MNRTGLMVKRWSDWFQRRGYRTDRRNVAAKQSIMNNGRRRRLRLEQLECRRLLALLPVQEAIMLGDVKPGESSSSIDSIVTLGNDTFFIENHGQLWVTRGLVGDAKLIRDFRSSTQTTWIDDLTTHSDKLVFRREVQQGVGSRTEDFLYFDPQAGEFHTWLTLEPNQYATSFWPNVFASDGSNLYFSIADSEAGNILLKADGDFLVTNLVTASFAQGGYAPIDSITPIGPEVVFTAGTKDFGYELWSTDGTQEGTKVIRDLIPSVGQPFKYSGADGLRFGQVGAIKQADFDGDGAVDFAVPGEILLGDGQGGIQRVLPYGDFTADQLGFTDFAIELLDFDLDGDQDLALVNRNLGELRVYENGFHGSMSLSFQLSVSGISRTLAVASIDSEPGEDLLVAVGNGIYQVVLGESVLLKPIAVTSGQEAIDQLKAKDLNRDGLVDLVVTEVSYPLGQSSPRISVLTKKSDGSYLSQSRPTSPDASWFRGLELAVADWNSDGLDDLVLGEISFGGLNEFGVILQGPTGFDAEISWSTLPGRLSSIETVESSDGVSSFVLIGVHSPSQWLVYPLAENLPAAGQPIGLAMEGSASGFSSGDFNGDGLTDFAMGDGDSQIITYTNFGHGSFGIYPAKQLTGEAITSVAFRNPGDAQDTILTLSHVLNATQVSRRGMIHDLLEAPLGYVPDVVLSGQATKVMAESLQGGEAKDLLILFPDGPYVSIFEDGSFLKDQRIALGSGAADIATGDWNADGRWDLAVSYPAVHRIVIYQQDLQGSFAPSIIRNLDGGGDQLLAVDFNSDGIRDLLIPDATSEKLWILPGHAGGLGATQHISIPGGPVLVQMADMDQKGMLDLVAVTSDSGLVVLLRNASGDVYATQRDAMSSSAFDLDLADISGDGWTDVIVTPSSGNQTLVYYGVMNGYVGYEIPQWVGSGMRQAVVGSVEGDAVPGIFTLLQTLPSGMQGSQSFGFVVEMRHDAVRAYPISDYPFAIPRDPSNPLAYFQTYRDDDYDYYYGYTSSFHLPGSYASMKNALWVTDGTSGGTRMVYDFKDLSSYGWYAGPNYLLGGVTAPDTFQRELWVSDGTTDGTKKLMTFDDLGQVFIPLNGKIYFLASTLDLGNEWWETDGTMEGTKFAFDLVPGPVSGVSFGASAIGSPGGFYFAAYTPESGVELWFSDGTSAGTYQAADVFPGPQSSQPAGFHWTGNTLVFDALTPGFGRELWAMGAAEFDFGDGPDSYGTLLGSDGARHRLGSGLRLGALLDSEVDGFPSSAGMGDDSTGSADEDAAESVPRLVLGAANTVTLITSGTGYLDLWLDANQDGQFSHPEEHYTLGDSVLLFQGENTFQWMLPEEAMLGVTYARLRLSATGGLLPTGEAMSGEVEDHRVVIRARDMQSDWQNPRDPLDTNYSGDVKPSDALVIINYLNSVGQGVLPPNPGVPPFWYDVNGDGSATPLDALRVINYLNLAGAGGEGESAIGSLILVSGDSNLAWPFASVEVIGGPTDSNDNLVWNELEWISNETFDEVVLRGEDDTTYETSGPGEDRAYTATTESVDQVMTDQELELILMTTPPLQTQLSSFWMELRKRMARKI